MTPAPKKPARYYSIRFRLDTTEQDEAFEIARTFAADLNRDVEVLASAFIAEGRGAFVPFALIHPDGTVD